MSKSKLIINQALRERWVINGKNILDSKSKDEGYDIFKFCYNPDSGEFLCDAWPSNHKEIIQSYGTRKFDDYVRGIYFKEKKIIYLRQHNDESWLIMTQRFLREHGAPNNIRIIWGKKAAEELAYELKDS